MLQQFACLEKRYGGERAIVLFRNMAHWYLKGMQILKRLRGDCQTVRTRGEMDAAITEIRAAGPVDGNRTGVLPDVEIPVPSGPVDKW